MSQRDESILIGHQWGSLRYDEILKNVLSWTNIENLIMNIQRIMDKFPLQRKWAKLDKQRKTDIMNIQSKYCIRIKVDKCREKRLLNVFFRKRGTFLSPSLFLLYFKTISSHLCSTLKSRYRHGRYKGCNQVLKKSDGIFSSALDLIVYSWCDLR